MTPLEPGSIEKPDAPPIREGRPQNLVFEFPISLTRAVWFSNCPINVSAVASSIRPLFRARLIAVIHYNGQRVYIRAVLTYAEYDLGKWKD